MFPAYVPDNKIVITPVVITTPPVVIKPNPSQRPPLGWEPGVGDRLLMLKHLGYWGPLRYSNETENCLHLDEGRVSGGKITVPLHNRHDWQHQIEDMNNYRILELWIGKRFGFCDTGPEETRVPYGDNDIPYSCSIDSGGNRRNGKEIITQNGNKYIRLETQDWNASPNPNITYETDPQLVTKQVDHGVVRTGEHKGESFWRTSEVGDCVWPFVSRVPLLHRLMNVTIYPGYTDLDKPFQPFYCQLFGFDVRVVGYCVTGSDTWVLVDGGDLESGWYHADGYRKEHVFPTPGTDQDYFCNVSGVSWPRITPPMAWGQKS